MVICNKLWLIFRLYFQQLFIEYLKSTYEFAKYNEQFCYHGFEASVSLLHILLLGLRRQHPKSGTKQFKGNHRAWEDASELQAPVTFPGHLHL